MEKPKRYGEGRYSGKLGFKKGLPANRYAHVARYLLQKKGLVGAGRYDKNRYARSR